MNYKKIILSVLYLILGVILVAAIVFALASAYDAPFAVSIEHYINIDLQYYEFELLKFSQQIMVGSAIVLIAILVFFDNRVLKRKQKN